MPENDQTNEEQPVEPKNPAVSFVFPCLNEERTIGQCIEMASRALEQLRPLRYEIVVADNGSEDASAQIAASMGAKVVSVEERGYGAALRGGFEAAQGEWIIMADADGTYPCERAACALDFLPCRFCDIRSRTISLLLPVVKVIGPAEDERLPLHGLFYRHSEIAS